MLYAKRNVLLLCAIVILLLLLLFGWNSQQPPSAYYKVHRVPIGASREEVYEILGQPSETPYPTVAYYYRPLSFGTLYLNFDKQERFVKYHYEEY